jgi:hypothetical protein
MASAPQSLPLFYERLEPLSSQAHGDFKVRATNRAPFLAKAHAVPLTADEFTVAQRSSPIVFSSGESPVPLALMGLNEGVNTFVDDEGALLGETYVPAYVRRYPFMLARLRPGQDDLSLCFDSSSDIVGSFEEGEPLFADGQPSQRTQEILGFNEQYEMAIQRTAAFVRDLQEAKLLIDGEVGIQPEGLPEPIVYRGFQMVDEKKLEELRGDVARKMIRSAALPLIYAHLFSLSLARDIFTRQVVQGKGPLPAPEGFPAA